MSGIGRLPTSSTSFSVEDDELELLELQLAATNRGHSRRLVHLGSGDSCEVVTPQETSTPKGSPSKLGQGRIKDKHFFTHPRRRQKQRSLMTLWSDKQLLDDLQPVQTRKLLTNILSWDFNAFTLDRLSNGRNLPTICGHLFRTNNLLTHFRLDALTVWKFFTLVEQGYHAGNPYHNGVHAADVTQAMACFLAQPKLKKHMRPIDVMSALIAAVCHDVDHPGYNEKFLIATSSHLAGLYNNSSVLENHHWRSAISMMKESGFSDLLSAEDRTEMEKLIRNMILATDISRQQEFLTQLKQYQENNEVDLTQKKFRHFILQIALKCADISNPCRIWNVSRLWSYRACEEFFRQGDRERDLGLPVTSFCDRNNISVAKVQSGFYRFIASPLFEEWNRYLASPLSNFMLNILCTNQARWDLLCSQESRPIMAESMASQGSSSSSSGGGSVLGESRRDSLDPPHLQLRLSRSSAEGDDDSDPCTSYPYMPLESVDQFSSGRGGSRRHSLPVADSMSSTLLSLGDEEAAVYLPSPGNSKINFIRQSSLGERRRSLLQTPNEIKNLAINLRAAAAKRRIFASPRQPISAVESLSSGEDSSRTSTSTDDLGEEVKNAITPEILNQNIVSVTTSLASDSNNNGSRLLRTSESSENSRDGFDLDIDQCNKNVVQMQQNLNKSRVEAVLSGRRGSAPCNLLINQMNAAHLAATAAVVAASVASSANSSRDNSPSKFRNCDAHTEADRARRGSLPTDLLSLRNGNRLRAGWMNAPLNSPPFRNLNELNNGCFPLMRKSAAGRRGSAPISFSFDRCRNPDSTSINVSLPTARTMSLDVPTTRLDNLAPLSCNNSLKQFSQLDSQVHMLRNKLLSPSVESEIIDRVVSRCTGGRRGSLPTDLNHLPRYVN